MALLALARVASAAGKAETTNIFMKALMDELRMAEIPFRWMDLSRKGEQLRGLILLSLDDKESIEYAAAFWETLEEFKSGNPQRKARARKRLAAFKAAAGREMPVPSWALPAKEHK